MKRINPTRALRAEQARGPCLLVRLRGPDDPQMFLEARDLYEQRELEHIASIVARALRGRTR